MGAISKKKRIKKLEKEIQRLKEFIGIPDDYQSGTLESESKIISIPDFSLELQLNYNRIHNIP